MEDNEKFLLIGGLLLILPFVQPLLDLANEYGSLISLTGLIVSLMGVLLMLTDRA
jgi:hypothetical protein